MKSLLETTVPTKSMNSWRIKASQKCELVVEIGNFR